MITFAYMGKQEWRGFEGSALVAWVFQSNGKFHPQLRTKDGLRLGPDCNTIDTAKGWLLQERRRYEQGRTRKEAARG